MHSTADIYGHDLTSRHPLPSNPATIRFEVPLVTAVDSVLSKTILRSVFESNKSYKRLTFSDKLLPLEKKDPAQGYVFCSLVLSVGRYWYFYFTLFT